MQRSAIARATLWLTLLLAPALGPVRQAAAGTAESIAQAREALVADDPRGAARLLEDALLGASKEDRTSILPLLRRAYESAAQKAEAAGRSREAESYRINLSILDRKPGDTSAARKRASEGSAGRSSSAAASNPPSPPQASTQPPAPEPPRRDEPIARDDDPLPPRETPILRAAMPSQPPAALERLPAEEPSEKPSPASPGATGSSLEPRGSEPANAASSTVLGGDSRPLANESRGQGQEHSSGPRLARGSSNAEPRSAAGLRDTQAPPSAIDVATADDAFNAKRYDEAGRIYGALAQQSRLPDSRRDHWAYCRCAAVVRRINANPRTPEEWARIREEVEQIRALSPKMYYGGYLLDLVNERSAAQARQSQNQSPSPSQSQSQNQNTGPGDGAVIVRGAAPEEPPSFFDTPVRRPAPPQPQAREPQAEPHPTAAAGEVGHPGPAFGKWQTLDTPNFRILHADAALADRVARVAEMARSDQTLRWSGSSPRSNWKPRCDIYLYPNAEVFSQMTEQPVDSPGFSTMGLEGGRIVARRINLRADHQNLLVAVLPHEVAHVVLADLFPTQQIPRWADEGMAALAEPASEQHLRAADLTGALSSGKLFKLDELMTMDYPAGKHWALYFAQSVSLTKYLVERGTPTQFIAFLRAAQKGSVEESLRAYYQIESMAELQRRWIAYARGGPAVLATSPAEAPHPPSTTRRQ